MKRLLYLPVILVLAGCSDECPTCSPTPINLHYLNPPILEGPDTVFADGRGHYPVTTTHYDWRCSLGHQVEARLRYGSFHWGTQYTDWQLADTSGGPSADARTYTSPGMETTGKMFAQARCRDVQTVVSEWSQFAYVLVPAIHEMHEVNLCGYESSHVGWQRTYYFPGQGICTFGHRTEEYRFDEYLSSPQGTSTGWTTSEETVVETQLSGYVIGFTRCPVDTTLVACDSIYVEVQGRSVPSTKR